MFTLYPVGVFVKSGIRNKIILKILKHSYRKKRIPHERKVSSMKKLITLLLAGIMMFCLACGAISASAAPLGTRQSAPIVGGYTQPASPVVTLRAKNALNKALEGSVGSDFTPVALIDTQVVAGTNYRILCKISPVIPEPQATYSIVTVYEDLQGNAEITGIEDCNVVANTDGWQDAASPVVTLGAKQALEKATAGLQDVGYSPVALVETKVGLGSMGYGLLCKVESITPSREDQFALIYVTENIFGNAKIVRDAGFVEYK